MNEIDFVVGEPAEVISTISGNNANNYFGWNVSDCGDVNGDGFEDIIVGAPGYNSNRGRAYIFFGGPWHSGDLSSESANVTLNGSWADARFGWDVSGAGDFNGDGFNDTIIGAPGNDSEAGAAYIFFGGNLIGGVINSSDANVTIAGENPGDHFGSSVSGLGDVSKEIPIDHVVISEVYADAVDETAPEVGEFIELYNPTSTDVLLNNWLIEDADGHSFTISGTIIAHGFFVIAINNYQASTDPTEASWPSPDFDCGYSSGTVFANTGDEVRIKDENGNIVDTFGYGSDAEWYEGSYHPILSAQGGSYERKWGETLPNGGNGIDTDNNNDDFYLRTTPEPQNTASPIEVPPTQSVYEDVIVGAYGYGNNKGRAYIFYGSSAEPNNASDADVILTGENDLDLFGFSVSGAGDVNSDDYDDILVGAPGFDNNRGKVYVYCGAKEIRELTDDIKFAHWDESDGAVNSNSWPIHKTQSLAQCFIPDDDYLITKISVNIAMNNASNKDPGDLLFKLKNDTSGLPPQDFSAQAITNTISNIPLPAYTFSWVEFEFNTPYKVKSGTKYWLVGVGTGKNGNECWIWKEDEDDAVDYLGDAAWALGEDKTWTLDPVGYDYWFKVYGRLPKEIAPTVTLTGKAEGDLFGWSVADAGDINFDNFSDLIVGAPGTTNGTAYVILGSNKMSDVNVSGAGWGESKLFANYENGGNMELIVYTGQSLSQSFIPSENFNITRVSLYVETFGAVPGTLTITLQGSTGIAPDTIPDGVILAQAPSISTGNVSYEWTDFIWDTPYLCTSGTEYFIVAEGTGADQSNCWVWYLNGWGGYTNGNYAYNQSSGWIARNRDCYFRAFGMMEAQLPNITIEGEFTADMFGYSVASAGNFNGDIYDDVVIGAPFNGNGKAYIFNCSNIMPLSIQASIANYTSSGENLADRFGWSVSGLGNVNQTIGYNEVIVGAPNRDPSGFSDAGKAYILSFPSTSPPPVIDLPFRINNDTELVVMAAAEGWTGDGSSGNPYIIEDYSIDGGGYGYCIFIGNTTLNFIIRNCTLENSTGKAGQYFRNSGIYLFNATNGILENNNITGCEGNGINIEYSSDVNVINNTCNNNNWSGIYTGYYSKITMDGNTCNNNNASGIYLWSTNSSWIVNNTCINNSDGIILEYSDNNYLVANIINNNFWEGIYLDNSNNNTIMNNTCTACYDGIYLYYSDNNTVTDNQLSNNTQGGFGGTGLFLDHADNNNVFNNNCSNNKEDGIYIFYSDFNTVDNNTCQNNPDDGISVYKSINNTLANNTCTGNQYGIFFENLCCDNIIDGNNVSGNGNSGIYILNLCNNNTIINNIIFQNGGDGIYINDRNKRNTIENNTISENSANGINLTHDSDEFVIIYNNITGNSEYGVRIFELDCENNSIHHNGFFNNNVGEIQCNDSGYSNFWNDTNKEGNFWDDYEDIYVPPATSDGRVWDIPYDINGSANAQDLFPLAYYPWGTPPINNPPTISDVKALPNPQEIGGFINISCNVTDDFGVTGVLLNVTLPGGSYLNVSMIKGNGNVWYNNSIYNFLGIHDYVIWSKDTSGEWNNSSGHSFTIQDTTSPQISNVTASPNPQGTGGFVNISCNVTDNLYVFDVWVNITLPNGSNINISLTKGTAYEWYNDTIYTLLGIYNYVIWANDTSFNWNCSSSNTFSIVDSSFPVISNVSESPDPQEAGGFVNISCEATDDNGIYNVWINITLPGGGYLNVTTDKGAGDIWFYDSIYTILGFYTYTIWANDTTGNWISSSGYSFTIQDTILPEIADVKAQPDVQEPNGNVNISCNVTDSKGVYGVWVNLTFPGGGYTNVSMTKGNGDEWFSNTIYALLGIHDYVIWVNDTIGNWNFSSGHNFLIKDTTLPLISDVKVFPDIQETGGNINISINVTDNVDVTLVWINLTQPDGGSFNVSMNKGPGDIWYYDSAYTMIGIYDCVIWAGDSSGNFNSSLGYIFTVQDTTIPEISNVLDFPDPQETGDFVNITCFVIDNLEVLNVWVNITFPDGNNVNISMTKGTGNQWYYVTIYDPLGIYDYAIWIKDTSDNWNFSLGHTFTIRDSTLPIISDVDGNPQFQETNNYVNITCNVTDNFGVSCVWVNITSPGGNNVNLSMTKETRNKWYSCANYTLLGTYNFVIWANDTSFNWNNSQVQTFYIGPGPPFNIILISGDSQNGTVGTELVLPLVVEVRDQYGNLVPNVEVWFNVTSGGGTLDVATPIFTKYIGRAQVNLTLGVVMGLNTVTAEIAGNGVTQVIFSAIGIPGPPHDIVIISGNNQIGMAGNILASSLVVEVRDLYGNQIVNADVWFNVTGGNGLLDTTNPIFTKVDARTQTNLTLGTMAGLNTVTAEIAGEGISQVMFTATGSPGPPYNIIIISGNDQSGIIGSLLPEPFIVEVNDLYGNSVPDAHVWFNVTEGGGSHDATNPLCTDFNGRAMINLTLGPYPGSNTVIAEINGLGITQVVFLANGIANQPEIVVEISNIELIEDDPPYTLYLFASAIDNEDLPQDLKWYIFENDISLYSVGGQGTNTLVITPKPNMYGKDLVTLLVRDSHGLEDLQPLWINISPVNDKPLFSPEPPDLTVTQGASYTFNYAPYILDIDNNINDLFITTNDPDHTSVSGHLVTYLYPQSMVNKKVFVTLILSDGKDTSSTVIQVNITEDNVPLLKQKMPDVMLFEGEIKYNVFDLDDYFYDPDGDAVYFSYGYSHIKIVINENNSVDLFAEGDWFGEEKVTFRARDPNSAIVEDTISVMVIPVNDPPIISGIPDLVVHYDSDYSFNLKPYITDPDTSDAELIISFYEFLGNSWMQSDHINFSYENNLKMVVNYPEIFLGIKFQVRIEVSDGTASAWDIINITVSENWQPELVKEIPDVVLYEDEYVMDYFNIYEYFEDKDGDALFFTYGNEHVQVAFSENGSVDFYADENWFGIENITIRASDTSGALVEDIITVTVLPVNDPPEIDNIPDQEGNVGVTWVLDLSQYLHDKDNNIAELDIICDSSYVTVVGTVLIFQYPEDIREDIVILIVRDPENSNATATFRVTLREVALPKGDESDIFQYIWYLIIIMIILATILLLYFYKKGDYEVEEALLVYSKNGLLISYMQRVQDIKMDKDVMTGMFTAIQDFVSDVFESDGMSKTRLKVMELGDKKVMIEHGRHTYLAAVFTGGTWRLVKKLRTTLTEMEEKYADELKEWDGSPESLEGVDTYLKGLIKSQ